MLFNLRELSLPGCYTGTIPRHVDVRGNFMKLFRDDQLPSPLSDFTAREIYVTSSAKRVLRGMHFQLPPDDHRKIVVCLSGQVLDVVLDLRNGGTYGKSTSATLCETGENIMILPKGVAHGFLSQHENSVLMYLVETVYSPASDFGVSWDSFGFDWPEKEPLLSDRDQAHPALETFLKPKEW